MERFTYTNAYGQTISIGYEGNFLLDTYDGLTAAETIPVTTRGYNQNGYTLLSSNLGARVITIHFYVFGSDMNDFYSKRRTIAQVFNTLGGNGVLTYKNDFTSKSIDAMVSVPPTPENKMGNLQQFAVELTAHNPLWYDTIESALRMADYQGGLTFPIASPYSIFAQKGDIGRITNEGDTPMPIRIEFRGDASNPVVKLENTGEKIKVQTSLAVGEKLIIDTSYGNKTVQKLNTSGAATSAYNLITADSTFFSIPLGENKLSFNSDSGAPEVYLYWRNRYVGV